MAATPSLPETTRLGRIRLAISDLNRSLEYYTNVLGLSVQARSDTFVSLTARHSPSILVELQQLPNLHPLGKASRLGLYHFALLLPTRADLASFVEHLASKSVYFGSSDHRVSEALYLVDPDGMHIEVYADRPRATWDYSGGEIVLTSHALQFRDLLSIPHAAWSGAPPETTLGHLHFWVDDLHQARKFYCDGIGLDIMHSSFDGVLFVSAAGYHHHVGLNTWAKGAKRVEPTDPRLLSWELLLENDEQLKELLRRLKQVGFPDGVDPWNNRVALATQAGSSAILGQSGSEKE